MSYRSVETGNFHICAASLYTQILEVPSGHMLHQGPFSRIVLLPCDHSQPSPLPSVFLAFMLSDVHCHTAPAGEDTNCPTEVHLVGTLAERI